MYRSQTNPNFDMSDAVEIRNEHMERAYCSEVLRLRNLVAELLAKNEYLRHELCCAREVNRDLIASCRNLIHDGIEGRLAGAN